MCPVRDILGMVENPFFEFNTSVFCFTLLWNGSVRRISKDRVIAELSDLICYNVDYTNGIANQ